MRKNIWLTKYVATPEMLEKLALESIALATTALGLANIYIKDDPADTTEYAVIEELVGEYINLVKSAKELGLQTDATDSVLKNEKEYKTEPMEKATIKNGTCRYNGMCGYKTEPLGKATIKRSSVKDLVRKDVGKDSADVLDTDLWTFF